MPLSDKIILKELSNGNEQVYHSLFDSYYPTLMQFAYRFLFDKDACKDIVQEVFITLWEKREVQEIKSLKWYLHTAVKNKCLSYLRNIGIKDKHQVYLIDSYLLEHSEEEVLEPQLVKEVNEALNQLPREMKRIFRLKYLHGLTMNEIAEDLDISVSTVKTQLGRARIKLRNLLFDRTLLVFFL
ncbi:RNA polymerase sigma-70 factor [Carboxylicivirga mesophila]|uniref:RNA polymerase sigma-70 factor n=1 Tax=Carboxylicivirga mesophila TaxID=1166478 RepID=A0ABS5KCU1_9BACT|nr:RNA polymerase sigma-70 factor [Carboxylicivirga mesophila]MBS2212647.1 RNA polymerase sigma-70 factor [Carboxylicivirga mesophila]